MSAVLVLNADFGPLQRAGVLARDERRCAFCGGPASTVDHVLPRSRGGGDTWENTVAACARCNNRKGGRTPAEARMPLRWSPVTRCPTGSPQPWPRWI